MTPDVEAVAVAAVVGFTGGNYDRNAPEPQRKAYFVGKRLQDTFPVVMHQ